MPRLTDHIVIARHACNRYRDIFWYHDRWAPDVARDFTLAIAPDLLDGDGVPEVLRRHCLKCGQVIVTDQAIEMAKWESLERWGRQKTTRNPVPLTAEQRRHYAPLNGNREFHLLK